MERYVKQLVRLFFISLFSTFFTSHTFCAEIRKADVYSIMELTFHGPMQNQTDVPARDIDFWVRFRHESGLPEYKIHGFWDGDGRGGIGGNIFKVRFCPTKTGRWNLVEVYSNKKSLRGQKQGDYLTAAASGHPGFWIVDSNSPPATAFSLLWPTLQFNSQACPRSLFAVFAGRKGRPRSAARNPPVPPAFQRIDHVQQATAREAWLRFHGLSISSTRRGHRPSRASYRRYGVSEED